jgi:WD40 repeat protein
MVARLCKLRSIMPRRYIEKWASHSPSDNPAGSIACLAFSIDGTYLAGGNLNGTLVICASATGQRLHILRTYSGILSLSWAPLQTNELWVGYADGRLVKLVILSVSALDINRLCRSKLTSIFKDELLATGFLVYHPVEWMAFDRVGRFLATGGQSVVRVWQITRSSHGML